jgi:hypothetical protein
MQQGPTFLRFQALLKSDVTHNVLLALQALDPKSLHQRQQRNLDFENRKPFTSSQKPLVLNN